MNSKSKQKLREIEIRDYQRGESNTYIGMRRNRIKGIKYSTYSDYVLKCARNLVYRNRLYRDYRMEYKYIRKEALGF